MKQLIETITPKIDAVFYTIDFGITKDGRTIVLEGGDGQVSGLKDINPVDFYRSLMSV